MLHIKCFEWSLTCVVVLSCFWIASESNAQIPDQADATANVTKTQAGTSSIAQELERIIQRQQQSWNEGDLEKFMAPYWNSEELTFSSGGNTTRGWQATLDRYKKNYQGSDREMGKLSFDELEFKVLSDSTALVLGRWKLQMTDKMPQGNFSLVWQKIDGEWKIIHDHSSSITED